LRINITNFRSISNDLVILLVSGYKSDALFLSDIFICPESRRTYIAIGPMVNFFPVARKLFLVRFRPLGVRNGNKNVCVCSPFSVRTRMAMYAKVIYGFSWNSVYRFVRVVGSLCRNPFFEILFFCDFSSILDFLKVAFIGVYASKCLCEPYLLADPYQNLHTSVFG